MWRSQTSPRSKNRQKACRADIAIEKLIVYVDGIGDLDETLSAEASLSQVLSHPASVIRS